MRIVGQSWKVVRSFQAYETGAPVTHMRQVEGTSLLVTVAVREIHSLGAVDGIADEAALQEEPSAGASVNQPVLKVWALDKPVKKTGIPTCLSTVAVNNGKKPFPVRDR